MKTMKTVKRFGIFCAALMVGLFMNTSTSRADYNTDNYRWIEDAYVVEGYCNDMTPSGIWIYTYFQPHNRNIPTMKNIVYGHCVDQDKGVAYEFNPFNCDKVDVWEDHEVRSIHFYVENGEYAFTEYGGVYRTEVGYLEFLNSDFEMSDFHYGSPDGDGNVDYKNFGETFTLANNDKVLYALYGEYEWIEENAKEFGAWAKQREEERIAQMTPPSDDADKKDTVLEEETKEVVVSASDVEVTVTEETEDVAKEESKKNMPILPVVFAGVALALIFVLLLVKKKK